MSNIYILSYVNGLRITHHVDMEFQTLAELIEYAVKLEPACMSFQIIVVRR